MRSMKNDSVAIRCPIGRLTIIFRNYGSGQIPSCQIRMAILITSDTL